MERSKKTIEIIQNECALSFVIAPIAGSEYANLYGRETDARRGIHGFEHGLDQLADFRIHRLNRFRDGFQKRVRRGIYGQKGHGVPMLFTLRYANE